MSTISSVSRGASVGVDYSGDMSNMTPEDVLAYCQTRLHKLQEDVSKQADTQRKMNRASEVLADLSRTLGEVGKGKTSSLEIVRLREAYAAAAEQIGNLGGPEMEKLAARLRDGTGTFDATYRRQVHFSDGWTYELNPGESNEMAQARHDGWVAWNSGDPAQRTRENEILCGQWEGDFCDDRDGKPAGAAALPQAGAKIVGVSFYNSEVSTELMQHLETDLKNTQGILNENSQTGLDELRNLTQQKQQALQLMQQMLQALQEQMRAAQQWR
jgi:CRISPR/Cas system-associated endoribonuclease Cas2